MILCSYVEWSLHEPFPGVYDFEGIADLEYFIELIKNENMYLILRPGPYICAERDFVSSYNLKYIFLHLTIYVFDKIYNIGQWIFLISRVDFHIGY